MPAQSADLPRFTLVGATTRSGLLSSPLRSRWHGLPPELLQPCGFTGDCLPFRPPVES